MNTNILKSSSSCNNCGKFGHIYGQCKLPIISYGIILFQKSNKGLQYLMIRRKDSFGYIDFIRGKYTNNLLQMQRSIDEMSISEKERLLRNPFEDLWKEFWGDNGIHHRGEIHVLTKKFESIKSGIMINDKLITLEYLIQNSTTSWQETEWEFPKGHKNFQEKDLDTALREFEEETGYLKQNITVIENIMPYEEIFIGSNHKSYKHKYFVAYLKEDEIIPDLPKFQESEVSKIEWKSLDECLSSIRPYNLEKQRIIKQVNYVLTNYILS